MAASLQQIKSWIEQAQSKKCTHLIVAVDTFDYEDYPVYVTPDKDIHEEIDKVEKSSMQRVMEVYNVRLDIEKQLREHRAYNI